MTLCLSIRQPWAELILHHGKDIENRDWRTNVRGKILIHASNRKNKKEINEALLWCKSISARLNQPLIVDYLSFGCIVGQVDLVDCVENSSSPWFLGRYGFVLRDPVAYAKPIPYRGQLGFFNVPDFDFRLL